jgi:hypothetical protein
MLWRGSFVLVVGLCGSSPIMLILPDPPDKGRGWALLTLELLDNVPFFDFGCAMRPCHIIKAPRVVGRVAQAVPSLDSLPNGVRGNGVRNMPAIRGGAR